MKFVISNFLSNEDLSISYESWDVQLTFDTLINTFRFKAYPLGGAKVKNACGAKLAEFRKTSAISSSFIKTFWILLLVKDLTNHLLFLLIVSFWEHTFFARMRRLKNGWLLSAPPRAYFYHPQLPKKFFGESWHQAALTQKKLGKFWCKLKEYKPYQYSVGRIRPPREL